MYIEKNTCKNRSEGVFPNEYVKFSERTYKIWVKFYTLTPSSVLEEKTHPSTESGQHHRHRLYTWIRFSCQSCSQW